MDRPESPALLSDAEKRAKALQSYEIMDTPPEQAFDDLTYLTSFICSAPIALVTFLDTRRQWFKSTVGVSAQEVPLEHAFCTHAIKQEKVFIIEDASKDKRFASNPLVTGEYHIRFYAGAPLITREGIALGTLCVIDRVARELTMDQSLALSALSRQVVQALEMRRTVKSLQNILTALEGRKP